jgi:hypothetical protein
VANPVFLYLCSLTQSTGKFIMLSTHPGKQGKASKVGQSLMRLCKNHKKARDG